MSLAFPMQLMVDGRIGFILSVMLNVDQENEAKQELATTHPPQVADWSVWDLHWKQLIVPMDLA